MKFIKLSKDVKADNGDIFAKDSILEILSKASKYDKSTEVQPVTAKDEDNLPYNNDGREIYTLSNFNEKEHKQIPKPKNIEVIAFGSPGMFEPDDESEDGLSAGLIDTFAEKDYQVDTNGIVKKKADIGDNMLSEDANISTDFSESVEGGDDPGTTDNYTEDTSTHETTKPLAGPLAMVRKLNILKKKMASEDNNLTQKDEDTSMDFDKATDGAGTVDKGTYKADEKPDYAKPPILGPLAKLKSDIKKIQIRLKKAQEFNVPMPSDGDSGGDNLTDFELDDQVDNEGSNDENRLAEAKKRLAKRIAYLSSKINKLSRKKSKVK